MSSRSLNKVMLIGNLTRDPELRYTPRGSAVASFGLATNREWTSDGVKKEAADFHNVVAWNKLAELCQQLLVKGSKVYVEGRLQTRDWTNEEGVKRYKTEVIIDEMILLRGGKGSSYGGSADSGAAYANDQASVDNSADKVISSDDIDLDNILSDSTFDDGSDKEEAAE
jgi:single-strand DNA-binding protein